MKNLLNTFIYFDAPEAWGIYFQDSATPQMEGLVELHDNIMYYLVLILFAVGWILFSIIRNFAAAKAPISHKYLNHGKRVPIQKYFKFNNIFMKNLYRRFYSVPSDPNIEKYYEYAYLMKKSIIKENKDKSGIYKITNKLTNDIYVGQSINLGNRFTKYFNLSYLNNRDTLVIYRALIKYGYSNFSITILEYCNISDLTKREQYYMDKLNPKYNTLKIGGCSLGRKLSEQTKIKISKSLKGIYTKEKSAAFGRIASEETRAKMSSKRRGMNNPLFGKVHSDTKELMKQKALGRKHSEETLLKMSTKKGYPVYIYEKCDNTGFKLIGNFVSIRKAANFIGISANTVKSYVNSGSIFKERYKFTSTSLK